MSLDLSAIPEVHHDAVATALRDTFGAGGATGVTPVAGGASGALTYRVESTAGPHFLRVETLGVGLRNPHQYTCMGIAAEADIAPPIRYLDEAAGMLVLPFLDLRPLAEFPGGPAALARDAGALLHRLHEADPFPAHGDHLDNLSRLFGALEALGRVAPGLLSEHADGFAHLRAAYPWDPATFVSGHNDPNQSNLIFDGQRLWLVDWETASRNDPTIDLAGACAHLAPTAELRDVLLAAWLGREPDVELRARLAIATLFGQLFAGCILLLIVTDPSTPRHDRLDAPSVEDFAAAVARGDLVVGEAATTLAFAKVMLRQFRLGLESDDTVEALRVLAG